MGNRSRHKKMCQVLHLNETPSNMCQLIGEALKGLFHANCLAALAEDNSHTSGHFSQRLTASQSCLDSRNLR